MGRNSNEFHLALHLENTERYIVIDQNKKKDFNIVRSIFEFSHVVDNGNSIVFDFDWLLVNMVDDDEMYDKICAIWDGDETDTTSNRVENETEILSEMSSLMTLLLYQKTIHLTSQHQGKMEFSVVQRLDATNQVEIKFPH